MLRTEFPSSPLPLSILPTIKSLGRSSYALGATTTLYRHLLRTAWIQHSSYTYIDTLLVDMNNGAIEFDADILTLLDSIIKEHEMARSGRLGREMQLVYGMEQFLEGIKKVRQWRSVVAERLGVSSDERRVAGKVIRRVDHENKGVDAERLRGPRHLNNDTEGSLGMNDSRDVEVGAEDQSRSEGGAQMRGDMHESFNETTPVAEDIDAIPFAEGDTVVEGNDVAKSTTTEEHAERQHTEAPAKLML